MPDLVASCGIFYLIFDFPTPKQTLLDISLITEIYHFGYGFSGLDALQALLWEEGKVTGWSFQEIYAKVFNQGSI